MKMIALRGFRHGSRPFTQGEEFEIDAAHARLWTVMGRARKVEEPEPPKRRQYRRRDMTVEGGTNE
jgi:hypothetical protein